MPKFPITPAGLAALQQEIKHLRSVVRPQITQAIAEARSHGDLSENAEYHAAKEQQGHNEDRIAMLEQQVAGAEVIDIAKLSGDTVMFGSTVQVENIETGVKRELQIVGEYEADSDNSKISIMSPVSRALIGKSVGDFAEVNTPRGAVEYLILRIGAAGKP